MDKIVILGGPGAEPWTVEADTLDVTLHPECGALTVEDGSGTTYGYAPGAWQAFELTRGQHPTT